MANTQRETILALVKTALETIATPTYEQTVQHVYFPPSGQPRGSAVINMRDMGDATAQLSRLAYEHAITLDLECRVTEMDNAERRAKLERLIGDVVKVLEANNQWSSQAISTLVRLSRRAYGEESSDSAVGHVDVEIIYRVQSVDPFTIRGIGN